jgi:hypothetical protein
MAGRRGVHAMTTLPQNLDRRKAIFDAARKLPVEARCEYLQQACGSDAELREHVEQLLSDLRDLGEFLAEPTIGVEPADSTRMTAGAPGSLIGPYKLLERIGEAALARSTWPSRMSRSAVALP